MIQNIKNQIFLGTFTTDGESMDFDLTKSYSELRELGDIVYFFVKDDEVLKVGKAGGNGGFYNRVQTYKRGMKGDQTNKIVIGAMLEHNIEEVDIYAMQCPRMQKTEKCLVTGEDILIELPTNVGLEKHYLALFNVDHDLKFCKQIN